MTNRQQQTELQEEPTPIHQAIRALIDSRPCAAGKTRDTGPNVIIDKKQNLSTWGIIKTRNLLGDRCLVVLPSIALCVDYYKEFKEYLTNENLDIETNLAVLHSQSKINVQEQLHIAINDRIPIIVITQHAFLEAELTTNEKSNYYLIVDEAIDPYRELQWYHSEDCKIDFDWANNSSCLQAPDMAVEWNEVRFWNLSGNVITDGSDVIKHLSSPNWRSRMKAEDYAKLTESIPKAKRVSIIQELRPEVFASWAGLWIAAAHFEVTFMRYWFDAHNITWRVHRLLGFKMHKTPVKIVGNGDPDFKWSSFKQANDPDLIKQFAKKATDVVQNKTALVLRNSGASSIYNSEILLPHNSAGGNDWREYEYVSLESALNPSPKLNEFLEGVYGISQKGLINGAVRDQIHMARTVYCFYQTVMRSCLRDGKPATVFCLDNRVILGLSEFFENIELSEFFLKRTANELGRPTGTGTTATGIAMTPAERMFIKRKRKDPKYMTWTNQQILDLRSV